MEQMQDLIRYHTKKFFSKMTGREINDTGNSVAFTGSSISAVMDISVKGDMRGFIGITMPKTLAEEVYAAMLGGDAGGTPEPESAIKEVLNIIAGRIVTPVQREIPGSQFSLPRITVLMPEYESDEESTGLIPFSLGEETFFMEFSLSTASETV